MVMMINPYLFFVKSTIGMFLERASWNDDDTYESISNATIEDIYADQMDEDGNVYDCLIFDQADVENSQDLMFGNKSELEPTFNKVREMLKKEGLLKEFYDENEKLNLDECLILAESLHSLI